jgi:hypothetical protein
LTTFTVIAVPMTVVPLRTVNVTVPSLTTPAVLLTVADRDTDWPELLNETEAADVTTVADAALIVRVSLPDDRAKFDVPS